MKKIRIVQVSVTIVVLVFVAYYMVQYFQKSKQVNATFSGGFGHSATSNMSKRSTYGSDPTEVALDGILINLKSGQYRYMKADMTFKMKDQADKDLLEKNMKKVRDLILRYSSSLDSSQLSREPEREAYKKELKKLIYQTLGFDVQNIYFRNFVLAQ
ncbi:flagellar basal body-associated FliL family protein [Sulfurospirillum sp. 1612]|uniref:flagellar basal body-associated FliL family protein n=1 Tax=Sulfurospirillum sp. 1612 TaxID=3094835 RepID=UPI002F92FDA8